MTENQLKNTVFSETEGYSSLLERTNLEAPLKGKSINSNRLESSDILRSRAAGVGLAIFTSSGGANFAYNMVILNPLNEPIFKDYFNLDHDEYTQMIGNAALVFGVGAMIGCLITGHISRIMKRNNTMHLIGFVELLSYAGFLYPNIYFVFLGRFISGYAGGLGSTITGPYIIEIVPLGYRNHAKMLFFVMMTFNNIIAYSIAYIFESRLVELWQYILMFPIVFTIIRGFITVIWLNYDSPTSIFEKETDFEKKEFKDEEKAKKAVTLFLSKIYVPDIIEELYNSNKRVYQNTILLNKPKISAMFRPPYRIRVLTSIMLTFSQQASGASFLVGFSSLFFGGVIDFDKYLLTILVGLTNFTGSVIALLLASRYGKKSKFLFGLSVQGVSFALLSFVESAGNSVLIITFSVTYMIGFGYGMGGTLYAYVPEILPSAGVGIGMFSKWFFISTIGKLIPIMSDHIGFFWTLNIFSFFAFLAIIMVKILCIETNGKNADEIEAEYIQRFSKGYSIRKLLFSR